MIRIHIEVKELGAPLQAEVGAGRALLIGRAPDPSRIDWSALDPQTAACALVSAQTHPGHYTIETLTIASNRISANHLLVLNDGAAAGLYDLNSRNGSWVKLTPQRSTILLPEPEVKVSLAGAPQGEPQLPRPRDAQWDQPADFGMAVAQCITIWLKQCELPVRVLLHPPGSAAQGLKLADEGFIELQEEGTLNISGSTLIDQVSEYIHDQNTRFSQIERRASAMIAASPVIRQILLRTADAAASGRRTILLGATGVGKELLARSYHGYSPRHSGPFVTVNCALLNKDLLYAQLFGARRGSFTGAVADIAGLIEAAHGGTLFLDELGELCPEVQKALLRFLDSRGEYYRLGEPRVRHADVLLVCATNAPLDDSGYRSGRFRDDLWYRLASSVIRVPALRERPEDVRAFLESRPLHGGKWSVAQCLTPEALALALQDPWPGNFRDLENFVDRLPASACPHGIDRAQCEAALREGRAQGSSGSPAVSAQPTAAVTTPAVRALAESVGRLGGRPRIESALPANAALGWDRINQIALSAFLEDQGEHQAGWDQLQLFVERYLKPMFVAHAAAPQQAPGASLRSVNYAALARRLHIGDGSTVKTHLSRFAERFTAAFSDSAAATGEAHESSG